MAHNSDAGFLMFLAIGAGPIDIGKQYEYRKGDYPYIPPQPSASVPDQELKRAVQRCLDAKSHSKRP
jgi:hypothetical protein